MRSFGDVLLVSATALALSACSGTPSPLPDDPGSPAEAKQPELIGVGQKAPDFTLQTIDGKTVELSDLRGRVVVLDFWTTWCLGCVQELPIMNEFNDWAAQEDLPITVLAINTYALKNKPKHLNQVRSYLANNGIELEVALDPVGEPVAKEYGVRAFPSNVIIDPEGMVTTSAVGMQHRYIDWLKGKALDAME